MPRFAANLAFLYPDQDFLARFACAARDGFGAVEFFFPYAYPAAELAARLQGNGLRLACFNATPRRDPAERGIACLPERRAEFREGFLRALDYAEALDGERLHVMPGIVPPGADRALLRDTYAANLAWAAERAGASGRLVVIEPINGVDMPGFFLRTQAQAHAIVREVGSPRLKVMMDLYHCQMEEGGLDAKLREYLPNGQVGHMQVAGVPGRHEPDAGEADYPALFKLIDELGYAGWVGCEYHPRLGTTPGGTTAGLAWMRALAGPGQAPGLNGSGPAPARG